MRQKGSFLAAAAWILLTLSPQAFCTSDFLDEPQDDGFPIPLGGVMVIVTRPACEEVLTIWEKTPRLELKAREKIRYGRVQKTDYEHTLPDVFQVRGIGRGGDPFSRPIAITLGQFVKRTFGVERKERRTRRGIIRKPVSWIPERRDTLSVRIARGDTDRTVNVWFTRDMHAWVFFPDHSTKRQDFVVFEPGPYVFEFTDENTTFEDFLDGKKTRMRLTRESMPDAIQSILLPYKTLAQNVRQAFGEAHAKHYVDVGNPIVVRPTESKFPPGLPEYTPTDDIVFEIETETKTEGAQMKMNVVSRTAAFYMPIVRRPPPDSRELYLRGILPSPEDEEE